MTTSPRLVYTPRHRPGHLPNPCLGVCAEVVYRDGIPSGLHQPGAGFNLHVWVSPPGSFTAVLVPAHDLSVAA